MYSINIIIKIKFFYEGVSPTIRVRVEEPRTQRVPVGATVTFRCTGVSQVSDVSILFCLQFFK